jgi:hypothetical protein
MVSQVTCRLIIGISIALIGLAGAVPTRTNIQPKLSPVDGPRRSRMQPMNLARNKLMENPNLFGGDMLGGLGFGNKTYSPTGDSAVLGFKPNTFWQYWTGGVLTWQLDSTASGARSLVLQAIADIEAKTCIRFKEQTAGSTPASSFITITSAYSGCYSYVGMKVNGSYELNLQNSGCYYVGTVIHELLHALGFYHEHQRYDRDTYITVNLTNVRATSQNQFTVNPLTDTNDVGVTYDYQSIMHYGSYAFSSNGERTIIPKQSGVTLIEAYDKTTMSSSDAQVIQKTYAGICNTVATTTTTVRTTTATTARTTTTTRRSGKAEFFRFLGWLMSFFA